MWMYCLLIGREKGMSDEQAEAKAREMFPTAHFIVVGQATVRPFVKAEIDAETAALLSEQPKLLGGTAQLAWVPDCLQADVRRVIIANQVGKPGCGHPECTVGVCGQGSAGLGELLERLGRAPTTRVTREFVEFLNRL